MSTPSQSQPELELSVTRFKARLGQFNYMEGTDIYGDAAKIVSALERAQERIGELERVLEKIAQRAVDLELPGTILLEIYDMAKAATPRSLPNSSGPDGRKEGVT